MAARGQWSFAPSKPSQKEDAQIHGMFVSIVAICEMMIDGSRAGFKASRPLTVG